MPIADMGVPIANQIYAVKLTGHRLPHPRSRSPAMTHADPEPRQLHLAQHWQGAAQGRQVTVALHGQEVRMRIEEGPCFLADAVSAMQEHIGVKTVAFEESGQQCVWLFKMGIGEDSDDHEGPLPVWGLTTNSHSIHMGSPDST